MRSRPCGPCCGRGGARPGTSARCSRSWSSTGRRWSSLIRWSGGCAWRNSTSCGRPASPCSRTSRRLAHHRGRRRFLPGPAAAAHPQRPRVRPDRGRESDLQSRDRRGHAAGLPDTRRVGPPGAPRSGHRRARYGRGRGRVGPVDRPAGLALRQRLQHPGPGGVPAGGLRRYRAFHVSAVLAAAQAAAAPGQRCPGRRLLPRAGSVAVADLVQIVDDRLEGGPDLLQLVRRQLVNEVAADTVHVVRCDPLDDLESGLGQHGERGPLIARESPPPDRPRFCSIRETWCDSRRVNWLVASVRSVIRKRCSGASDSWTNISNHGRSARRLGQLAVEPVQQQLGSKADGRPPRPRSVVGQPARLPVGFRP